MKLNLCNIYTGLNAHCIIKSGKHHPKVIVLQYFTASLGPTNICQFTLWEWLKQQVSFAYLRYNPLRELMQRKAVDQQGAKYI